MSILKILKHLRTYYKVQKSGLFDPEFYLTVYPDIRHYKKGPFWHYLLYGANEGRLPYKGFDKTKSYEKFLQKIYTKNPLLQYIQTEWNTNIQGVQGPQERKQKLLKNIHTKLGCRIAIKSPSPMSKKEEWGDYHYANSLKAALELLGYWVTVDCLEEWYSRKETVDIVIVLRGLSKYIPQKEHFNIVWNISHPDKIKYDEYAQYDLVYVASQSYAQLLSYILGKAVPIKPLLQATDVYSCDIDMGNVTKNGKILFIGNSRKVYRNIVKWCIELGYEVDIYGTNWQEFVPEHLIKGSYIENGKIKEFYKTYSVVLNDHWDSMRDYGFISNRIFDVLSCGGTVVSDYVPAISALFGDRVHMVKSKADLRKVLSNQEILTKEAADYSLINEQHSFSVRALQIKDDVLNLYTAQSVCKKNIVLLIDQQESFKKNTYYRLIYPLTEMTNCQEFNILVDFVTNISTLELLPGSIIVIQYRTLLNEFYYSELTKMKCNFKLKIVLDIDLSWSEFQISMQKSKETSVKILDLADQVVCFSENMQNNLYHVLSLKDVLVIPNYFDPRIWKQTYYLKKEFNSKPVFMYVGSFIGNSGKQKSVFDSLAYSYSKNPNLELVVIGKVENSLRENTWIKQVNIDDDTSINYPNFIEKYAPLQYGSYLFILDEDHNYCSVEYSIIEALHNKVYPLVISDLDFDDSIPVIRAKNLLSTIENLCDHCNSVFSAHEVVQKNNSHPLSDLLKRVIDN